MDGVVMVDPDTGLPHARVLAAGSAEEAVALVESVDAGRESNEPVRQVAAAHPRLVLLAAGGDIAPEDAGLYGCLGYLTMNAPPERMLSCFRCVAEGAKDAPEPFSTRFFNSLWSGSLTPLGRQLLHLAAQGAHHDQMREALHVSEKTLERLIHKLRVRLGLDRTDHLGVAARNRGFGAQ
jgi:DNA-binding NarL/FixJ family response regulator